MSDDPSKPAELTEVYARLIGRALEEHLRDRQQMLFNRQHRLCFKFGRCVLHSVEHQFDCPVEKLRDRGITIQRDGTALFTGTGLQSSQMGPKWQPAEGFEPPPRSTTRPQ